MDPFELPDELPTSTEALNDLAASAQSEINVIRARHEAGEDLSDTDVERLRYLVESLGTINDARQNISDAAEARQAAAADLLSQVQEDGGDEDGGDEDGDNDSESTDAEQRETVTAAAQQRPVSFSGVQPGDAETPDDADQREPGWVMAPDAPGYREGRVGFAELARAIDSVRSGSRRARSAAAKPTGNYFSQGLARLERDVPLIEDSHALVAEIERVTSQVNGQAVTAQSLTAAGGWCAPSEQLYDFCDVPDAVDLISLPELTINRGGIRWPVEPDLSAIFESFEFFFTEPQLEAVDVDGNPTAIKECVSIPCPDEFEEIRLNAVGYCVEAGILQTQGWPELIEWFMRSLAAEHLRAISRRTINDMVAGSGTPKVIPPASIIGSAASVLNSLALQAVNLRLNKGLARTATIEGVAPAWLHEVLRADLAMRDGRDVLSVSDAEITGWLTARNIALQFVGDWQSRATGLPGHLDTVTWPDTVDVLMYPAGTWFRSMSNVIEMGVMYPKEQLQVNRYTRFFTEDAIAVGKRCNQSILVRVPLQVSGAIGARQWVTDNAGSPQPAVTP
ncbi:major head protein [Gordonia phage Sour]|uniref:Major capsid hexamer protein n=1 Tax=Gordonia phage Sour TaxID=2182349 RepID=A0A2U8UKI8_9CAUD|nr:major head protein [Gordonia phage Sour]AWN04215.1 major capsid hexamer protein [Gordonia phage Sour]